MIVVADWVVELMQEGENSQKTLFDASKDAYLFGEKKHRRVVWARSVKKEGCRFTRIRGERVCSCEMLELEWVRS